ncbi:hypothetical protein WDW86_04205 [Bdellovibrionota bacterium FG-2]
MKRFILMCSMLAAFGFAGSVKADDDSAREKMEQGRDLYAQRGDLSLNDQAIAALNEAAGLVESDDDLKYEILVLESRAVYWKGNNQTDKDQKKATHDRGMALCKEAMALNDDYADAHYFYGVNLARWAEANGVISSLFRKDELMKSMADAMDRNTQAGDAGEMIDGYGPHRTMGRVYFKLPGFAGGSNDKSTKELDKAYANAPTLALNAVYLAETLADGNKDEKARARQILDQLLSQDPATLNPDRVPETQQEFAEGRNLRKGL